MNLIGPAELIEAFSSSKSMAVVGNSPSVKDYSNGELIDSHDIVVRFNRIQTTGMETSLGTRTDILCVNAANSISKAPSPQATVTPKFLICFVSPQGCRQADFRAFGQWTGELPILLTFGPDLIGLNPAPHSRPLTSGSYVLFTLLRLLDLQRVFVTGFTMFGAVSGGAGKVYEDQSGRSGTFHDIDQESKILAEVLSQFPGELSTTPEVHELLERFGSRSATKRLGSSDGRRERVTQWLARGISWRLMGAALALRRICEAR